MNDNQIRRVLKATILAPHIHDPGTLVLDELGLRHGRTRVDVVVVNGAIHGYEIKSNRDTLQRLPEQVRVYGSVLDYATLVVGSRHAERALPLLPDWWGVELVGEDDTTEFSTVRRPQPNPEPDPIAIAKLLWRSEALALLEQIHAAEGVRSKARAEIYARLGNVAPLEWLRDRVRHQLRARTDWRAAILPMSGGD